MGIITVQGKSYLYSLMVQSSIICFSIASVLLLGVVIITIEMVGNGLVTNSPAMAQTALISSGNMTTPMMESASFHLRAADRLLMDGNTNAALDQISLAEIQLSLLNMGPQETSTNQTQAVEFIIGGSLSSMRMAANCIIDNQAMVRCMQ
jgi:DNA-binding protein Fis